MMKIQVSIKDVSSDVLHSDIQDVPPEQIGDVEKVRAMFKNMKNMDYVSITVDGEDVVYNPDNIISTIVKTWDE